MPRRRTASTLKRACLEYVVRGIDSVWCADIAERSLPVGTYLNSPFSYFPLELANEVIDLLKVKKKLLWHHILVLFPSNQHVLNLSNCGLYLAKLPELVKIRTQRLQWLDLSLCTLVSSQTLMQLVLEIPNIVCLKLQSTKCTDEILCTLASRAPELNELDISWCNEVTDLGVTSLCCEQDKRESKISKLNLTGTRVGIEGAIAAVKHLPRLCYLDCQHTGKALEILHAECSDLSQLPNYALKKFALNCKVGEVSKTPLLKIVVHSCPHLVAVLLSNVDIDEADLMLLSVLKELRELQICSGSRKTVSFLKGIQPLLSTSGSKLTSLALANISSINLRVIGLLCPSLQELALNSIRHYESLPFGFSGEYFAKLHTIQLISHHEVDIPASHLRLLLTHSFDMTDVFLHRCSCLTDLLIEKILSCNTLPRLKNLHMEHCDKITTVGAMSLLKLDNDLRILKLYGCGMIKKEDFQKIQEVVSYENLDVEVSWSSLTD